MLDRPVEFGLLSQDPVKLDLGQGQRFFLRDLFWTRWNKLRFHLGRDFSRQPKRLQESNEQTHVAPFTIQSEGWNRWRASARRWVLDWKRPRALCSRAGQRGVPPTVPSIAQVARSATPKALMFRGPAPNHATVFPFHFDRQ